MKKKLSKTGQALMRTAKTQIYREYMRGYSEGEKYISTCDAYEPLRAADVSDEFWDGFVDGYNDTLETMRLE